MPIQSHQNARFINKGAGVGGHRSSSSSSRSEKMPKFTIKDAKTPQLTINTNKNCFGLRTGADILKTS